MYLDRNYRKNVTCRCRSGISVACIFIHCIAIVLAVAKNKQISERTVRDVSNWRFYVMLSVLFTVGNIELFLNESFLGEYLTFSMP